MLVCYISHPYTAESEEQVKENIAKAEEFGKKLALIYDYAVIVPHKNTGLWDMDIRFKDWSHERWLNACLSILSRCDVVALCGNWTSSKGCIAEHKMALALNKDILYIEDARW